MSDLLILAFALSSQPFLRDLFGDRRLLRAAAQGHRYTKTPRHVEVI